MSRKINNIDVSIKTGVDYFIFYINSDIIKISSKTKHSLGIKSDGPLTLSQIHSKIISPDLETFNHQINDWLNGDTSKIIQIQMIDNFKMIRTIQIKGHLRYDNKGNIISIYGAYVDLSNLGN